ncbi:TonB-dependent receptor [Sphingosinicella terrae]|uniref:TonB-dependent receptor n=1 Tax=Sphingosinicella terrae TaxID=2172047 RepID=UPI000E0D5200|nr:TonB-dependent receptor [Sphingosinicella terrae]
MKISDLRSASGLAIATAACLWSVAAPAQTIDSAVESGAVEAESGAVSQDDQGLADIVVTAQRRAENLQDVPISVASVGGGALEANGIETTRDIQFAVPTLVYNQASSFAQPFLRGIGSDITAPNADPSVATYVDGVFVANTTAVLQGLLGVDRIEVLQGPQGTLYGRNAVGGAVNVYTLTPRQELEGRLTATYGNYDLTQISGFVSGGVTDTLALGIYGAFSRRDTYLTKINPNIVGEPDHQTSYGVRVRGVWNPASNFTLTGSFEYQRSRGFEEAAFRNIQPDALAYLLGAPVIIRRRTIDSDYPQIFEPQQISAMLRADVDFGWAQFVSLSGYRDLDGGLSINDLDGTSAPVLNSYANPISSRAFSQELQLLSPSGSRISWILGLYYYNERSAFEPQATISPGSIFLPPPIVAAFNNSVVHLSSYAAFGQATMPLGFLSDDFRLTLGGRFTRDEKRFDAFSYLTGADLVELPGTRTTYPRDTIGWSRFTPKITLDYRIGETLLYGTYSSGFKSGAYNVASPATPGPVDPETLDAFEIGAKNEFAGGRIRLNLAAYFYSFKDIQVQRIDLAAGGATTLQNAAEVEAYGIDATLTARVSRHLTLNASAAWEHGEYVSFPDAATFLPPNPASPTFPANTPASVDVSGNRLQRTPEWTFSAGADFRYPLANGGSINATANWYYNDGYFWEPTNRFRQSSYHLVNATLGYTFPGDRFTVTAFVRNLTNSYYSNSLLVVPTAIVVQDGEPRMYGVTASVRF